MINKIKCLVCEQKAKIDDFQINEAALLVCPNCGAEFQVSALLTKIPGEGKIEGGEDAVVGEPDEFETDDEMDFSGEEDTKEDEVDSEDFDFSGENEEEEQEEEETEEDEEEEKEESIRVVKCLTCNRQWLGIHANKCNVCESTKVMLTDKPITECINLAKRAILVGNDVEKVVDKIFTGK